MSILAMFTSTLQAAPTDQPATPSAPTQSVTEQMMGAGNALVSFDLQNFIDNYVMPWGINIVLALVIYVIGKIVVKVLVSVFGKIMAKSKYDDMLIDFLKSIVNAILMLFVIVASLDQLGVDTTSLVAILGAAGLAIGLSLQGSLQNFAAGAGSAHVMVATP